MTTRFLTYFTTALLCAALAWSSTSYAQTALPRGILQSIAINPQRPNEVFTAGSGSVFYSDDSGQSWSFSTDTLLVWSIKAHASDADSTPLLVAGTLEEGVRISTDGGSRWSLNAAFREPVRSVAIAPDGQTIFAAAESGLKVSRDQGQSWQALTGVLGDARSNGLVVDQDNPNNVYVSSWGEGVWVSADGGQTWTVGDSGLSDRQIFDLDRDPLSPATLYATTPSGVFRSVDAGINWLSMGTPFYATELAIDPLDPARMYLATSQSGLYLSEDAGLSWQSLADQLQGVTAFASITVAADATGSVYAGSVNEGLFISRDRASSWQHVGQSGGSTPPPEPDPDTTLEVSIEDLQRGETVAAGARARYRITVRNGGGVMARNAVLRAYFSRLRLLGDPDPMGVRMTVSGSDCGTDRTCELGDLVPGQSTVVEFYGATDAGALTRYRLSAIAEADNAGAIRRTAEIGSKVTIASSESGGGSADWLLFVLLVAASLLARSRAGHLNDCFGYSFPRARSRTPWRSRNPKCILGGAAQMRSQRHCRSLKGIEWPSPSTKISRSISGRSTRAWAS